MQRRSWRFRPEVELLESREVLSTYYVSTSGNNSNNGLADGAAWRTLQHAAGQVAPGDLVIVRPGNYQGFQLSRDGAAGAAISFRADAGVIINQARPGGGDGINLEGASHVVIEGFRIEGNNGTVITRAGIRSVENDHVTIRNNIANGCFKWGILTGFTDDLLIEGNTTTNSVDEHGIYVSNSCFNITIRNNTSSGNRANGIHMNGDLDTPSSVKPLTGLITNALVEGNVIFSNGTGTPSALGSGINCDGVQDSIFRNNLIYNAHQAGISLYQIDGAEGSTNNLVVNNTFLASATGKWAVQILSGAQGSTGNTVFNNIIWSGHSFRGAIAIDAGSLPGFRSDYNVMENRFSTDGGDAVILDLAGWQAATGQDTHSVTVSSLTGLFANLAGNDYHLADASVARDRGIGTFNSKNAPAVDRDGLPRPSGSAFDIGAYELQASGPGSLQFSAATYSRAENGGTATITVTRTGGTTGSVSVQYATSHGTAGAADYTAASGMLTFGDGETSKTFTVTILNDSLLEGNETVNLTLSNVTGATLGSPSTAVLTITDDEVAQPGVLQFSAASYSVNENGGTAAITVTRTGGSNVAVNVQYATSNGSATAGSDYTAASGTLSFGVGETSKTFTVTILNDTAIESPESINLTLSNPTNGATLGTPSTAVLTIQSEDTAAAPFQQASNGLVVIEAEHNHANVSQGGKTWLPYTVGSYSGTGALRAMPNTGTVINTGYAATSPRLDFQVNFVSTGIHYVWIRGRGTSTANDTLHVGLNGQEIASADRMGNLPASYAWIKRTLDGVRATLNITTTGVHTINVWMREDGVVVDKLLLTTSASFTPSGKGPAESPRSGGGSLLAAMRLSDPGADAAPSTAKSMGGKALPVSVSQSHSFQDVIKIGAPASAGSTADSPAESTSTWWQDGSEDRWLWAALDHLT